MGELSEKMNCTNEDIAMLNYRDTFSEPYIVLKPLSKDSNPNSIHVFQLDYKKPFQIVSFDCFCGVNCFKGKGIWI